LITFLAILPRLGYLQFNKMTTFKINETDTILIFEKSINIRYT
jgi:hypothetical protein